MKNNKKESRERKNNNKRNIFCSIIPNNILII